MEWKRLGDVATFINGYAFKPDSWSGKGKPIVRIQNLNNKNADYNFFDGNIDEKYTIYNGDILISWSASIGSYVWSGGEAYLNQHIFKVEFNKMNINKFYFKYMVDNALIRAQKYIHGSTMKHITKKYFDGLKIPIADIETQEKIVQVLDNAQSLIDKRKEQIILLDKLTESIFYEMFGDPIKNEKGWESKKVDDLCELINGDRSSKYPSGKDIVDNGILFVSTKNIVDNNLDLQFKQFITYDKFLELGKGKLQKGDLILTLRGSLGNSAIFESEYETGFINAQLLIVRCKKSILNVYLHNVLKSKSFRRIFNNISNGAAVQQLTAKQIRELKIPLPPLSLQNEFAIKVEEIEKQKNLLEDSLVLLEDNYKSLMQRAFKGELFN